MGNWSSQPAPAAPLPDVAPAAAAPAAAAPEGTKPKPPKCKACCACPETKLARDECIMERGPEGCEDLIQAHRKCMRDMGFDI